MSSSTKTAKLVNDFPATLIKNIRAVAAVTCYDILLLQDSMKQDDQWRFIFNCFHGNEDRNIMSQIQSLLSGFGTYSSLYNKENPVQVTDRDTQSADAVYADVDDYVLVLKDCFSEDQRYIAGRNFTIDSLSSPTKKRMNEKITGRNIYDLAMSTIKNVKKAMAIADEWLQDGKIPSGACWEDLCQHIISETHLISSKKSVYTGWIGFSILTKYNDSDDDALSVFDVEDRNRRDGDKGSRDDCRKKRKIEKDDERSIAVATGSITSSSSNLRGINMNTRLQMIELAHFQDSKKMDNIKTLLFHRNTVNNALLTERSQAINLAQSICLEYDPDNKFWKDVVDLTAQITAMKKEISDLTQKGDEEMNRTTNKPQAAELISSCVKSDISVMRFKTPPRSTDASTVKTDLTNSAFKEYNHSIIEKNTAMSAITIGGDIEGEQVNISIDEATKSGNNNENYNAEETVSDF